MQDLEGYLAAFLVDSICYRAVPGDFASIRQLSGEGLYPTGPVRGITTSDYQSDLTSCAFAKVGCEPIMLIAVFETGMH